MQLASRTGALNEIEYSEFVQRMQTFADAVGAGMDPPDMLDVMARARELDAFASQHDAQLAVHLHARGAAWSVGYIQQHARRHGFVPGVVAGRLVYPSAEEGAPPVLTLTFDSQAALADEPDRAAVRDVTLAFDVPQTDASVEPFKAWQAAAQALAVGMDADIVDDDGRPLSGGGFAAIGAELGALYAALEARELAAGTPRRADSSADADARRRDVGTEPAASILRSDRRQFDDADPPRSGASRSARRGPARGAARACASLLRARRAGHRRRRLRRPVPGAAGDRGRASGAADAGLADAARDRRGARGTGAGPPRGADALDQHRDRHDRGRRREVRHAHQEGARPGRRRRAGRVLRPR